MSKFFTSPEPDFDEAATPRGPEEPQPGVDMAAPGEPARVATEQLVDRWVSDCIKGGPIGRHTTSFNHLMGALDELKRRLNLHLTREE